MKKFFLLLLFLTLLPLQAQAVTQNSSGNVAAAGSLTGSTLASGVTGSSLTGLGTVTSGTWHATPIANSYLASASTTVNGQTCTLGSTCTISTAASLIVGSTTVSSGTTGYILYDNSGTLGELNLSTLNIGGNAATVTTNANLTGDVTSTGNATTIKTNVGLNGSPTTTTQSATDNSTKIATTAQVFSAVANPKIHKIGFSTLSPTTGQQGTYVVFPAAGTITGWDIVADTGTATVQVWKIASGTAAPTVSNSISTSGVQLSTGTAKESTDVSDFTGTTVTAGDIFAFNLSAVSSATKLYFDVQITEQ